MKNNLYVTIMLLGIIILLPSCSELIYIPRSRAQKQLHKPSIVLLERIVEFRETYHEWPVSKEYFMSKGKRYKEAFGGFKYEYTQFKIIDNDNLLFYFDQHIKDMADYQETQQIKLNRYRGVVKFYRQNGRFMWKIKMN